VTQYLLAVYHDGTGGERFDAGKVQDPEAADQVMWGQVAAAADSA
jgi:hypothetical protein